MRDPGRIEPALDQIRRAWLEHPDLRLSQLLYNAARNAVDGPIPPCPPFFYMEDEVLLSGLVVTANIPEGALDDVLGQFFDEDPDA